MVYAQYNGRKLGPFDTLAEAQAAVNAAEADDSASIAVGDYVKTMGENARYGTVIADHGNGIVRVEFQGIKQRIGRKLVPYVADCGKRALSKV